MDNGVARIFVWGGHPADVTPGTINVISRSRPDSVGGGGTSSILHKRTALAEGGVAEIIYGSSR